MPVPNGISRALQSVLAMCSQVFIVVDALDECQASDGCRKFMTEIFSLPVNYGAQLFATSRSILEITEVFKSGFRLAFEHYYK